PRRGVRVARPVAAVQRGGPAAAAPGPVRAGHPDHAHRGRPRGGGPGDPRALRRGAGELGGGAGGRRRRRRRRRPGGGGRADGAMLWRNDRGDVAAFNIAHLSGTEGWMGPLAVRPELQGHGLGKEIVRAGVTWLRERGARVIGLETMPRTMDNIGFYSSLGF